MSTEQTAPLLSLVTGAMDRHQSLSRLIESIRNHTRVSWELIIADASELPLYIADARITRLVERPRLGHTRGYNAAFKHCTGTWVLWLNDDAEVLSGYDTAAIDFMTAHPEIGLGAIPYSERRHTSANTYGPFHVNNWRRLMYANFGIIQRSLGNTLGWFDEDFIMYGADNSIAFKVLLAGYGIACVPHKSILHHSPQDAIRAANQIHRKQSSEIMTSKYHPLYERMAAVHNQHAIPLPDYISPRP